MRKIIIGLVMATALVAAAPAGATIVVDETGTSSPWQASADMMRVPSVAGPITVIDDDCPWFDEAWGCYATVNGVTSIHLSPSIPRGQRRNTLWHELGHAYAELLNEADRDEFRRIVEAENEPWETGGEVDEQFAVAYGVAARYGRGYRRLYPVPHRPAAAASAGRRARYRARLADARAFRRHGIEWEAGYRATPARNTAVMALLERVAARNTRP